MAHVNIRVQTNTAVSLCVTGTLRSDIESDISMSATKRIRAMTYTFLNQQIVHGMIKVFSLVSNSYNE